MKKTLIFALFLGLLLAACAVPTAVEVPDEPVVEPEIVNTPAIDVEAAPSEVEEYMDTIVVDDSGNTSIDQEALDEALNAVPAGDLTTVEIEGLAFMREEEKLARDVYLTLYDQWNMPVFQNIANSEATHMDAVLTLIERFGLDDPATENGIGEFTNPDLQALYDQLVAQGSQSLADALKVGAAIEEIDILDLEEFIGQTDKDDIIMVYENLLKGSRNHLRSFTRILQQQTGEIYAPQYLSQEAYDAIISAGTGGPGSRGGGQGQGRNGRKGGNTL
ncbi:MAG: DUF2202 domain-containing protein [Chloroflexota bacterium]|nr:DUF2202 domain-containing protein [Chloroflexota bacterium]